MSVPSYRRKPGKLEVIVKARTFFEDMVKNASNEKKFSPLYYDLFTKEWIKKAESLYMNCWRANNIRLDSEEHYLRRKKLQEEALLDASDFLSLLSSAKRIFNLPKRRAFFWAGRVAEIIKLIQGWKKSDYDRYYKIKSKDVG